jgi:tripartite-type tricarboxylate transporter receptor subunit TctC
VAGQIQLGVFGINGVASQIKSGSLVALGVTTAKRTALLPDVPTIAEQGVPGYEIEGWFAAIGPKGLPAAAVNRINAAFRTALEDPAVRDALIKQGNAVTPSTPEQAQELLRREIERYGKLARQVGIKLE